MYATTAGHDTVAQFIRPRGQTVDPLQCACFSNMQQATCLFNLALLVSGSVSQILIQSDSQSDGQ